MKTNIELDAIKHNNFNPVISIVVPIYNVEQYLARCIESLINQTYKFIEIILVNDESPDNSVDICEQYVKKDSRIKLIHKKNGGLSDARNVGIKNATGEYILFVDSDDYIELSACEKFLEIVGDKEPELVVGNAVRIESKKEILMRHTCITGSEMITGEDYLKEELKNKSMHMAAWLTLYNRKFLQENNLEFKVGLLHEDEEFSPRVFLKAKKVIGTDLVFYKYIIRDNSITTSKNKIKNAEHIIKTCKELEVLFNDLEDPELKMLLNDNLVNKILNIFQVAKLYKKENFKLIDNEFIKNKPFTFRNKVRVKIFILNRKFYYHLNNSSKILKSFLRR